MPFSVYVISCDCCRLGDGKVETLDVYLIANSTDRYDPEAFIIYNIIHLCGKGKKKNIYTHMYV